MDVTKMSEDEIKEELRKQEVKQIGFKIAQELTDAVNRNNIKLISEGFVEGFERSHRTLQQDAARVIMALIQKKSELYNKGKFDLRNEDFCKFCADVVEKFPDTYFSRI